MAGTRVVVHGVLGRMGQEVLKAVCAEPGLEPFGAADGRAASDSLPLPDGSGTIPLSHSLQKIISGAQVAVDFSSAEGAVMAIRVAARSGVSVVVGTTGLSDDDLREAGDLARKHQVGIVIAPNFAIGAVLMIHLARIAGRHFDYADLIETHHQAKIDAPSGTALAIARAAEEGKGKAKGKKYLAPAADKETLPGTRGGTSDGGVSIHSARMQGRVAHHELVFGGPGQTLTIRHDSIGRESFMPGVMLAIREAVKKPGLTAGLEKILGL